MSPENGFYTIKDIYEVLKQVIYSPPIPHFILEKAEVQTGKQICCKPK